MWFNYSQSIINWVYGRLDYICAVAFIADLKLYARHLPYKYHFITINGLLQKYRFIINMQYFVMIYHAKKIRIKSRSDLMLNKFQLLRSL